MSRTSKCRLARAWASWVAWSAMNKPLEPALKTDPGRALAARCGQLSLDQRVFAPRVTLRGRRGICIRPQGWLRAADLAGPVPSAHVDAVLRARGHRLVRRRNSPRPRGPAHP